MTKKKAQQEKRPEKGLRIDGARLRLMRKLRGYSSAAEVADLSPPQNVKTIEKAERGGPVDPAEFQIICTKLKLNPMTLDPVPDHPPELEPITDEHSLTGIKIIAKAPKEVIDQIKKHPEAARLYVLLAVYGCLKHDFARPQIAFSSVIYSALVHVDDARRIIDAFLNGRLAWLDIESVTLIKGPHQPITTPKRERSPLVADLTMRELSDFTRQPPKRELEFYQRQAGPLVTMIKKRFSSIPHPSVVDVNAAVADVLAMFSRVLQMQVSDEFADRVVAAAMSVAQAQAESSSTPAATNADIAGFRTPDEALIAELMAIQKDRPKRKRRRKP